MAVTLIIIVATLFLIALAIVLVPLIKNGPLPQPDEQPEKVSLRHSSREYRGPEPDLVGMRPGCGSPGTASASEHRPYSGHSSHY